MSQHNSQDSDTTAHAIIPKQTKLIVIDIILFCKYTERSNVIYFLHHSAELVRRQILHLIHNG